MSAVSGRVRPTEVGMPDEAALVQSWWYSLCHQLLVSMASMCFHRPGMCFRFCSKAASVRFLAPLFPFRSCPLVCFPGSFYFSFSCH